MQSGVKLRLYVKCRGGEEVCEKRGLSVRSKDLSYISIFTPLTLVTHHPCVT